MKSENLESLFVTELKDLYDAEKQLVKALPKLAKACTSQELKEAITEHLEQTKGHVERIEEIFSSLDMPAKGKSCQAMKGLIEEGGEAIDEHEGSVRDAALIASAQKVEHYEMAGYGTILSFAQQLGLSKAAKLIEETLEEEKAADKKLTQIAESDVNRQALEMAGQSS